MDPNRPVRPKWDRQSSGPKRREPAEPAEKSPVSPKQSGTIGPKMLEPAESAEMSPE
ncbi:hypothetical protein KI387_026847, partial [Taxus chinensis]